MLSVMVYKAKNVVLNISEMEAKVREATNDEPWYKSHSDGNDPKLTRSLPGALQLLEYLIKHGSERVVDDARVHLATIKMLRNFHYIDEKGKDEGLNVRNRARELAELLSDVENIRLERRKAKANRHKYTGTGNDPMSFTSGGSRYGGFGSDSFSGGSNSYYGDRMSGRDDFGGSFSGSNSGYRDGAGRRDFEEYTAGDDETVVRRSNSVNNGRNTPRANVTPASPLRAQTNVAPPPKPKEPEVDLLGGFDEESSASVPTNTNKALPSLAANTDEDDFADFQAAPSSPSVSSTSSKPSLMEMLKSTPPRAAPLPVASPAHGNTSFNLFGPSNRQPGIAQVAPTPSNQWTTSRPLSPTGPARSVGVISMPNRASMSHTATPTSPPAKGLSGFEDLWSMSLGATTSSSAGKSAPTAKSIKDLEKEKAQAGIWASSQKSAPIGMGMGNNLGSFGSSQAGGASSSGGGDDLLL
ncbi:hypothetical protein ID866_1429 [Astraeus odoratus]|nr:hypothetical protein ID866_1429 [Astraeus odoratus]